MNFENILKEALSSIQDSRVKDAMAYSLLAGGKRLRPTFLFEVLKGYGVKEEVGIPFACAIEMIHTYSLIHDDLPAMDNDDMRRGKPTNHKQFDEATAILAGDGLLTYAFEYASHAEIDPKVGMDCLKVLAEKAGASGMIYGQCLDTLEEMSHTDLEELKRIHNYKTGCLFEAPLMIGAILAGKEKDIAKWETIGETIGLAFQVQDDVLDVIKTSDELGKTNSDVRNEKVTSVSLLGVEKAETYMRKLYEESCKMIEDIEGFESKSLIELLKGIEARGM